MLISYMDWVHNSLSQGLGSEVLLISYVG